MVIDSNKGEGGAPRYRYALVNRPAGYATIPSGMHYQVEPRPGNGERHHDFARHGILVPERQLTDAEILAFELVPLIEGIGAVRNIAAAIAATMSRYADAYLESSEDDPEQFAKGVIDRLDRMRVSVEDPRGMVAAVRATLQSIVQHDAERVTGTAVPAMG